MRLHEVLEACIEYVAIDGVIGSEPRVLQQYLRTLDPGIDEDFFVFIWSSLIEHPLLRVVITAYPINHSEGSVNPGTAPLPAGYQPNGGPSFPRNDHHAVGEVEPVGLKGRALAFALEGKDYKTDKETVNENRRAKQAKAQENRHKRSGIYRSVPYGEEDDDEDGEEGADKNRVFRWVDEDDGGLGDDRIPKSDLSRLYAKWGSRLRIRATDDEIYFRLTGSHHRIGKITPIVFHALQLCARSRERGITALELGPAINASQGSVHHFMKVLLQLGLCTKVPIVLHSSVTNLLLFHRFLHLNEHYRAVSRLPPLESGPSHTSAPQMSKASAAEIPDDPASLADEEDENDEEEDGEDLSRPDNAWNLDFSPITEEQLMAGHIVKDRLLRILEHPNLRNHLLKRKNILRVVGWNGPHVLRHRRAIPRVINALIHEGLVETLDVGVKRITCLRLTRFNPDYVPPVEKADEIVEVDEGPHLLDDREIVEENAIPYLHQSNAKATELMDYQIVRLAELSGSDGLTIADIRHGLDEYYKRNIETQFKRAEDGYVPPHLRNRQIVHSMDTQGKERRLKALTLPAYRRYMDEHGLPVDNSKYPPLSDEIGRWGTLESKSLWNDASEVDRYLASIARGDSKGPPAKIGRPKGKSTKRKRAPQDDTDDDVSVGTRIVSEVLPRSSPPPKVSRYTAQMRGRPRQYIHVVNLEGIVDRRVIGQVRPQPDLAPVWIHVPDDGMLYPAEPGYNGVGPPPPISDDAKKEGKTPSFFKEIGAADPVPVPSRASKSKKVFAKSKSKAKQNAEGKSSVRPHEETKAGVTTGPRSGPSTPLGPDNSGIDYHTAEASGMVVESSEGAAPADSTPAAKAIQTSSIADHIDRPIRSILSTADGARDIADHFGFTPPSAEHLGESGTKKGKKLGRPSKNTFLYPPASLAYQSQNSGSMVPAVSTSGPPFTTVGSGPEVSQPTVLDLSAGTVTSHSPNIPVVLTSMGKETSLFPRRKHAMYSRNLPPSQSPNVQPTVRDALTLDSSPVTDTPSAADIFAQMQAESSAEKDKRPRSPAPAVDNVSSASTNPGDPELPRKRAKRGKAGRDRAQSDASLKAALQDDEPPLGSLEAQDETISRVADLAQPRRLSENAPSAVDVESAGLRPDTSVRAAGNIPGVALDGCSPLPIENTESSVQGGRMRLSEVAPAATRPPPTPVTKGRSLLVAAAQGSKPASFRSKPHSGKATPQPQALDNSRAATPQIAPSIELSARCGSPGATPVPSPEPTRGGLPSTGARSRIDMGSIRRSNELYHAIKHESGGICETLRVGHIQYAYAKRVAGTDAPGANAMATQMDRQIVSRHIQQMIGEGRLKETKVAVQTTTGKSKVVKLVYLPEVSQQDLKQYIMALNERLASAYIVKRQPQQQIADMEYTEVQVPASIVRGGQRHLLQPIAETTLASNQHISMADVENLTPEMRRSTLLSDFRIVQGLYGYYSGKNARILTLHRAILKTFENSPDAASIVSATPKVFSLDMLFSEITVSEWFHCVSYIRYSEKLEAFARDPVTKDTKIRDVPAEVRPKGCFKGHNAKQKFTALLRDMSDLKLLVPLVSVKPEEAELSFESRDKSQVGFSVTDNLTTAVYYRLYDYAPLYHIASDALSLQGILPVRTIPEADKFWSAVQIACFDDDINAIPPLERSVPDKTLHAPLTDHLEFDDVEKIKMLRSRARWKAESRLVDVQSIAIETLFDRDDGTLLVKDEQKLRDFAWEWALPYSSLREHIRSRLARTTWFEQVRQQKEREERDKAMAAQRQRQAALDFTARLQEIKAAGKREMEQRVRAAAERIGAPFSPALENFVINVSQQSLRPGTITDEELDSGCRLFLRQQEGDAGRRTTERPPKSQMNFNPLSRRTATKKPVQPNITAKKVKKSDHRSAPRNRRKWSEEDDAQLLYSEAVIRARYKGNGIKVPGRHAMKDLFPKTSLQACLNRLKTLWRQPGKQAFYERLIDTYLDLWPKYRGTDALPDEDPTNIHDFELNAHVAFLMGRVPPESLMNLSSDMVPFEAKIEDLPANLNALLKEKVWDYASVPVSSWDVIYELAHDEQRNIITTSIPELDEPTPPWPAGPDDRNRGKLMSLLKTITGTPIEDYSDGVARALIEHEFPADLRYATDQLLEQKVIVKWRGASDGRSYMIHQPWIVASDGLFTEELLQEANGLHSRFEKKADPEGKLEWPLMGPPGEMGALMNMVSNHQVRFHLDPETFPTLKAGGLHYNTRKLNDIDFEYPFTVQRTVPLISRPPAPPVPSIYGPYRPQTWQASGKAGEAVVRRALQAVQDAGAQGLTRSALQDVLRLDDDSIVLILKALSSKDIFWGGYDTARLVHKNFWEKWTFNYRDPLRDASGQALSANQAISRRAVPRAWTDIFGHVMLGLWERAKRNVLSYIIARPGTSQRYLRNKIGTTLDRLEANEVLQWLVDANIVERRSMSEEVLPPIEAVDVSEEEGIAWYPVSGVLWQ